MMNSASMSVPFIVVAAFCCFVSGQSTTNSTQLLNITITTTAGTAGPIAADLLIRVQSIDDVVFYVSSIVGFLAGPLSTMRLTSLSGGLRVLRLRSMLQLALLGSRQPNFPFQSSRNSDPDVRYFPESVVGEWSLTWTTPASRNTERLLSIDVRLYRGAGASHIAAACTVVLLGLCIVVWQRCSSDDGAWSTVAGRARFPGAVLACVIPGAFDFAVANVTTVSTQRTDEGSEPADFALVSFVFVFAVVVLLSVSIAISSTLQHLSCRKLPEPAPWLLPSCVWDAREAWVSTVDGRLVRKRTRSDDASTAQWRMFGQWFLPTTDTMKWRSIRPYGLCWDLVLTLVCAIGRGLQLTQGDNSWAAFTTTACVVAALDCISTNTLFSSNVKSSAAFDSAAAVVVFTATLAALVRHAVPDVVRSQLTVVCTSLFGSGAIIAVASATAIPTVSTIRGLFTTTSTSEVDGSIHQPASRREVAPVEAPVTRRDGVSHRGSHTHGKQRRLLEAFQDDDDDDDSDDVDGREVVEEGSLASASQMGAAPRMLVVPYDQPLRANVLNPLHSHYHVPSATQRLYS